MKNVLFCLMIAVVALMSSCTKNEVPQISYADRLAQVRAEISANPSMFAPPDSSTILALYREKIGGLKGALIAPKVGFSTPSNYIYLSIQGGFKKIWSWTITTNDYLVDKGVVAINYNDNYEQVGDCEFIIGWDNQYCTPVLFVTNIQNVQIRVSLSYPVTLGNLSFDSYTNGEASVEIWLPQLEFDGSWSTLGSNSFGGTFSFNPASQTKVDIILPLISPNTYDYIKFFTDNILPNSVLEIYISDDSGNWVDKTTFNFSGSKTIPGFVTIPLTFVPNQVMYRVIHYVNGMPDSGEEFTIRECIQDPSGPIDGRIYVVKQ